MPSNVRATLEPKKQDNIRDILQGEALWDRPNMGTSKTAQNREVRSLEQLQIHPKCASILKVQRIHGHIQCGSINAKHSLQKMQARTFSKSQPSHSTSEHSLSPIRLYNQTWTQQIKPRTHSCGGMYNLATCLLTS